MADERMCQHQVEEPIGQGKFLRISYQPFYPARKALLFG